MNFAVQHMMGNVLRIERRHDRYLVEIRGDGAISLGSLVFHTKRDNAFVPVGAENRDHEWGHSVQSRIFGPFYLVVVGVPSVMRVAYAILYRGFTGHRWGEYYDGWPENSADRLGDVDRGTRPKA